MYVMLEVGGSNLLKPFHIWNLLFIHQIGANLVPRPGDRTPESNLQPSSCEVAALTTADKIFKNSKNNNFIIVIWNILSHFYDENVCFKSVLLIRQKIFKNLDKNSL